MATQGTGYGPKSTERGSLQGTSKTSRGREQTQGGTRRDNGNQSGENRGRDNRGRYQDGNGTYRRRDDKGFRPRANGEGGGYRTRDTKPTGGYNRYAKDKDEEDDRRVVTRSSRPKPVDKIKEQQPDKFETIKRLEREQKTIKKKENKKKNESQRPQPKQKRQNNRNYMNDYLNGDYDEDYFF